MPTTDLHSVSTRLLAEAAGAQHDHIKAAAAAGAFAIAAAISRLADAAEVAVKRLAGTQAPQAEPGAADPDTTALPAAALPVATITDQMIARAIAWQDKAAPALTLTDRRVNMRDMLTFVLLGSRP